MRFSRVTAVALCTSSTETRGTLTAPPRGLSHLDRLTHAPSTTRPYMLALAITATGFWRSNLTTKKPHDTFPQAFVGGLGLAPFRDV